MPYLAGLLRSLQGGLASAVLRYLNQSVNNQHFFGEVYPSLTLAKGKSRLLLHCEVYFLPELHLGGRHGVRYITTFPEVVDFATASVPS